MQTVLSHQYGSTTSDNSWGAVFEDGRGHLRSAVAAIDLRSGITAGQLVRVDDLSARKSEFSYILRNTSGRSLWSDIGTRSVLQESLGVLPDCDQGAARVVGWIVDCTPLKGPPLQLSAFVRSDVVMSRVLPLLPWTFLAHLLLLLVIALILQRQLGRPLKAIIELMHLQKQFTDLNFRLPERRKDELGCIAIAYNALLKTLGAYHQTLERQS
ncbi:hypothetical protein [Pseudomonas frederiksbergensis]|uniref:hypothetical protein n=1 Tax=Pseudomonas frederiksbergensis TaxID=104087 RepID=UPI003D207373